MAQNFIDIINREAERNNIPPQLLAAIIQQESSGNPNAVSPKGAQGLMQLMPSTARELGVTDPSNPEQNIAGGAAYIRQLLDKYDGDTAKALAAYNWGMGNVDRKGLENAPPETQQYLAKLLPVANKVLNSSAAAPAQAAIPTTGLAVGSYVAPGMISSATVPEGYTGVMSLANGGVGSVPTSSLGAVAPASGIGLLPLAGIAAGTALTGKGLYDIYKGNSSSGPLGLASRVSAGIATGGLSELARPLFSKPKTQVEEERWRKLGEKGAPLPEWVAQGKDIKAGDAGYRQDLGKDFIGKAPTAGKSSGGIADKAGDWVNNVFAKSRNEKDLRPEDIWGYAAFSERFGPQWMQTSEENRRLAAQKALDLGVVKEGKGTINLKDNPELDNYFQSLLKQPTPTQQPRPSSPGPRSTIPTQPKQRAPRPVPVPPTSLIPTTTAPIYKPYDLPARPTPQDYVPAILDVNRQNTVGSMYQGGRQNSQEPTLDVRSLYNLYK